MIRGERPPRQPGQFPSPSLGTTDLGGRDFTVTVTMLSVFMFIR